jgi:hypothetical protein
MLLNLSPEWRLALGILLVIVIGAAILYALVRTDAGNGNGKEGPQTSSDSVSATAPTVPQTQQPSRPVGKAPGDSSISAEKTQSQSSQAMIEELSKLLADV